MTSKVSIEKCIAISSGNLGFQVQIFVVTIISMKTLETIRQWQFLVSFFLQKKNIFVKHNISMNLHLKEKVSLLVFQCTYPNSIKKIKLSQTYGRRFSTMMMIVNGASIFFTGINTLQLFEGFLYYHSKGHISSLIESKAIKSVSWGHENQWSQFNCPFAK